MRCAAVIFDWAGTMVDFGSCAPVLAMRRAFAAEGVDVADADVRAGMGLAKRDHVVFMLSTARVADAWRAAKDKPHSDADVDRIFAALEPLMRDAGAERSALVPGALQAVDALKARGVRIGSTTGYTRPMMGPILEGAAAQGYRPEIVVCAGETKTGRPSPLMIWKALSEMDVWPASAVVKVDDAPVGIAEGKNAGCFAIGVAASGNALGLDLAEFQALSEPARQTLLTAARVSLAAAGADLVIDSVADLPVALASRGLIGAA